MEMNGERLIPASTETVWSALNDPDMLKVCLPGCEKVEQSGDDQYAVTMNVKVGPVGARFAGKIRLSDRVPPSSYKLAFEGSGGAAGFGKGSSTVTLKTVEGGCQLAYTVQAQVGGKIAQLGQRLVDGAAKAMADDFFKRFEQQMHQRTDAADVAAAAEAPEASAQGTARLPAWVWIGAALAAAAVAWLALRG